MSKPKIVEEFEASRGRVLDLEPCQAWAVWTDEDGKLHWFRLTDFESKRLGLRMTRSSPSEKKVRASNGHRTKTTHR